jgi:hypothetical protein
VDAAVTGMNEEAKTASTEEQAMKPIEAFGTTRPLSPDQPVIEADSAAVGPIEEGGSLFMLLLAEQDENYLFRIKRNDLVMLEQAIAQALRDTGGRVPEGF